MRVMSKSLQYLLGAVALVLFAAGGDFATNSIQRAVPVVPGVQGCWRLEGSGRQIDCVSREFTAGANIAAGSRVGKARDRAVIAYVRHAEQLAASDERLAKICHPSMHQLGR